jgi:two-component system, cell cycle sensor histidine kinase and response regulator CckA
MAVKKTEPVFKESNINGLNSSEAEISGQIIDHSRSMISIINRQYLYEKVNATFCREHQVVNETIVGRSLAEVWGDDIFRNTIKNNVDLCLAGQTVRYEASFYTPLQGKRFYEVVFRPIQTGNNEITHLIAETLDISDLRLSRQEAIEREQELRKFETNLPIGFVRCHPDGKFINVNKSFLSIMECSDDDYFLNMNLKNFYPSEYLFDIQVVQLIEHQSCNFGKLFLKSSKGNEIPCRISGFMAVEKSGTPSYIDFTVEDSSRELMLENRLLQAQKLETIGALAGGIAHDFNNILATISGYSEMLLEDLLYDVGSTEKVNKIRDAVLKAQSIISQILTFSRQVDLEKVPVNVSDVLKDTIDFIKSSVPSNISISSSIADKSAMVLADPTQIFRVFLNLMTNAMQSMEEKGGILSVHMKIADGKFVQQELNKDMVSDEYVILTFSDTGAGMDPALQERIFEPFFTTREVGKGTGLGLSVIHGIISEMDGEIMVSSKKEKGSSFYLYLPVLKKNPENVP